MGVRQLVSIELRFQTREDPGQLADRIAETVRMIVGREGLEEFRWKTMLLEDPERRAR